jgi:hypothetical protein
VSDPWDAWGSLAGEPWQHEVQIPGAECLDASNLLDEEADGVYVWIEESLYKTEAGFLFVRRERRAERPDTTIVIPGSTAESIVATIRAQIGMTPGRVEVLGRGGIEIGLEPDPGEDGS